MESLNSGIIPISPLNNRINNKRPVLLIHGLGDSKDNIENSLMYAELKKNYPVYIVEYLSGPENAYGDIRDYARTLDQIIETIKIDGNVHKVDIVAHSMGGLIARFRIQKIKDDDIGKLIMIGTPNHGSDFSRQIPYNILQFLINPPFAFSLLFNDKYQKENPNQALNEMLPRSDFLIELNGNHAAESDVSEGGVIDEISPSVTYVVLVGDQLPTYGSVQNAFVKGDGIVPFNSAKLSNVAIYPISAIHGEEFNKNDIITLVKEILAQPD